MYTRTDALSRRNKLQLIEVNIDKHKQSCTIRRLIVSVIKKRPVYIGRNHMIKLANWNQCHSRELLILSQFIDNNAAFSSLYRFALDIFQSLHFPSLAIFLTYKCLFLDRSSQLPSFYD
ncbi:hypothetical protein Tcan_00902, partial [Toxocara canis]